MRALMLIAAAAMIAGCTRPAMPDNRESFAQELAGRVAGRPEICIPTTQQQNLRVVDAQTLAYNDGPIIWVNHLRASCPGIEPLSTIIVEPKLGTQYCSGDHVRGLEYGRSIAGPTCFLGDWVPYRPQ
jgi:hypothetical protein